MPSKKWLNRSKNNRMLSKKYNRRYLERHRDKYKTYQNAYSRRWRKERREILNALKSQPCADCGVQYPPYVMDFDHVRGEKFCDVSRLIRWSLERWLEEIDKCDLVCANCHRIRTFKREHEGDTWADLK